MRRLHTIIALIVTLQLIGCSNHEPKDYRESTDALNIYPDYQNTTIPVNIAPLNFEVQNQCEKVFAKLSANNGDELIASTSQRTIQFPFTKWKEMLQKHSNETLSVDVYCNNNGEWSHYTPFFIRVVSDSIDKYVTFRLIEPSYESTGKIGLFEYDLETSKMRDFVNNTLFKHNPSHNGQICINCHTKQQNHPQNSCFYYRTKGGGLFITYKGETKKVDTKVGDMQAPSVYQKWHPELPFIIFSNNSVRQCFPSNNPNHIEAFDMRSDILLYDLEKEEISYVLKDKTKSETYPVWSADGKYIYYCSTDSLLLGNSNRLKLQKYNLMRLTFNSEDKTWSDTTLIYNAVEKGKSVSKPRVSPDNRYILMTQSEYGSYHYTHQDADLYLLDLTTNKCTPLDSINSPQAEGYATWSSNSRWIMVGSRKEDGSYVRLYFSYLDENGVAHKPFQMPHKEPLYDRNLLKNYNHPEFGTVAVDFNSSDAYKMVEELKETKPTYVGTMENHIDGTSGASTLNR